MTEIHITDNTTGRLVRTLRATTEDEALLWLDKDFWKNTNVATIRVKEGLTAYVLDKPLNYVGPSSYLDFLKDTQAVAGFLAHFGFDVEAIDPTPWQTATGEWVLEFETPEGDIGALYLVGTRDLYYQVDSGVGEEPFSPKMYRFLDYIGFEPMPFGEEKEQVLDDIAWNIWEDAILLNCLPWHLSDVQREYIQDHVKLAIVLE